MKVLKLSITDEQYEGIKKYLQDVDKISKPKKSDIENECNFLLETSIQCSAINDYIKQD